MPLGGYTPPMPLIVTGTIGIDTVHTPTGEAERVMGGSCAYFAAAASFQAPVRIVAAVGGDWPESHRQLLERFENISMEGLELRPTGTTFAWGGRYFDNMNKRETLFTDLGVLEGDPPMVPEAYRGSDIVFLGNTHPAEQLRMLREFPNPRLAVADTMDLWINIANEEVMELLQLVDGLVLNDDEAEQLTEIRNVISAGRKILEYGPSWVVIKKGEHGCVLIHHNGVATMPAFPADVDRVVDPTGAGDSFAGGMMGYLATVDSIDFNALQTSLAWGTVTASFTIESFSLDRLAALSREEIDERMRQFQSMTRVG